MSMSLREQLLQAGFGRKQQQKKQEPPPKPKVDAAQHAQQLAAQQLKRAEREAEAARRKQEQADRKARWDKIKELIAQHRLPKIEGDEDDYFNFIDRQKVRRIRVDASRRERLVKGELAIVRCEGRYDVVAADIAANIRECDARAAIDLTGNLKEGEPQADGGDDPYKDYVVPDDLRW
jgi:uncharacterized protein YaiL (DUF2058 family)